MRYSFYKMRALLGLTMLGTLLILSGCMTPTTGQAALGDLGVAQRVCKVWLTESYDSTKDTPETIAQVRANNRAQAAYCEGVMK
jgi:hypothetical protein